VPDIDGTATRELLPAPGLARRGAQDGHLPRVVPLAPFRALAALPELMRFLAMTAEGQRISRRIAEAGRARYFRPTKPSRLFVSAMLELASAQR